MLMRISCDDLGCGKSLAQESNCFCSVTLGKPLALSVPHLRTRHNKGSSTCPEVCRGGQKGLSWCHCAER